MRSNSQLTIYKSKTGCGWSNNFWRFEIVISRGIAHGIPRYICAYWCAFTVVRKSPGVYELNYSKEQDTASGPPISAAMFDVFSRYRETEKRVNGGIGKRVGMRKVKSNLPSVVASHESVCPATGRRRSAIYIFISRRRSHRIDGKRRDGLSSATAKITLSAIRVSSVIEGPWSASL